MVKIKNFKPNTDVRSGTKDPITFVITELGPFRPDLLQQGRRVSDIPTTEVWNRLILSQVQDLLTKNATIYIATGSTPSGTTSATNGATLAPATSAQIQSEVTKVQASQAVTDAALSSLSLLDNSAVANVLTGLGSSAPTTEDISFSKLRVATKGEVLKLTLDPGFNAAIKSGSQPTYLFVAFQNQFTKGYKVISGDTIEVDSLVPFQAPNGNPFPFLSMIFVRSTDPVTYGAADLPLTNPAYATFSRKVVFFQIKQLIPPPATGPVIRPRIKLGATGFSPVQQVTAADQDPSITAITLATGASGTLFDPTLTYLFTLDELDQINSKPEGSPAGSINPSGATFIVVPGYPMLWNQSVSSSVPSLSTYVGMIQAETPPTNLFAPVKSAPQAPADAARFIGNLDRTSLRVVMHDNDTSVILIDQGEAQPGFAVDYALYAQPDSNKDIEGGDVVVTVRLQAFPTRIPIVGQAVQGAEGVQLGVHIGRTPGQAAAPASPSIKKLKDAVKAYQEPVTNPEEFFFNLQIQNSQGQATSTNKYGTIKILEKVTFKSPDGKAELEQATIVRVDADNNIVFFTEPLRQTLPPGTLLEIPQSPLNAGRTYRVAVSCSDRVEAAKAGTPVAANESPSTSTVPIAQAGVIALQV